MSAGLLWARLDLRRRARSLVVLAVLVALTTTVVLAAVAGARRGESTVDRLVARTAPATLGVLPNQPGFDWDAVEEIDGVAALGRFAVTSVVVEDVPAELVNFVYDREVMRSLEKPILLEGRLADPDREDEVVITHEFERTVGKGVGDRVTLRLHTPEEADELREAEEPIEPSGPTIDAEIVGEVRSPWFSDYGDTADGTLVVSAALLEDHRQNILGASEQVSVNALVRLEDGAAGIPAFRERLAEVSGRNDIEFLTLTEDEQRARDVARFEGSALLAFAAAAAIAALFLVGQSVVRFVGGASPELEVLRAVGMSPREVRWLAAIGPALAGLVGALAGAVVAASLSSRFPIGTVAPLEPSPGARLDMGVLGGGALIVVVLVTGGALLTSGAAARTYGQVRAARPSRLAGLAARLNAPVPTAIGARFALERGSGSQSVPVLPAILGSVVGVLGIIAALTFADGIDDATEHPSRFGVFAELTAFFGFNGEDFIPADDLLAALAAVDGVASVNDTRNGVAEVGPVDLTLFTIDPVDEAAPIVVTDGSLPTSSDGIALAPTTAEDIGVGVGDTVEVEGAAGAADLTVTGLAFVPEGPHNGYDTGSWLTPEGYERLADSYKFRWADITIDDGADVAAVAARIGREVPEALGLPPGTELTEARTPPSRLAELKEIGRLPLFLAGFLSILAITAVGHAVATAVRRRRHDLAVLRAIGLTRGQTRRIALVQATVLALIGLVIGIPLGIALGRSLWRSVAESTPLLLVEPLALVAVLLIAPIAIVLANVMASWPSQRAASLRVGQVLRTE